MNSDITAYLHFVMKLCISIFHNLTNKRLLVAACMFWLQPVCFGCSLYVLVAACMFWLQPVCFGCSLYVLVAACTFWLQPVRFGCSLYVLVAACTFWLQPVCVPEHSLLQDPGVWR